jgi:hypothetical protein
MTDTLTGDRPLTLRDDPMRNPGAVFVSTPGTGRGQDPVSVLARDLHRFCPASFRNRASSAVL